MYIVIETYADNEAPEVYTFDRLLTAEASAESKVEGLRTVGLDNGWVRLYGTNEHGIAVLICDYL